MAWKWGVVAALLAVVVVQTTVVVLAVKHRPTEVPVRDEWTGLKR